MYKERVASHQRRYKVHEIAPQKAYIGEDILPDYSTLTRAECEEERARLLHERGRLENERLGAKRARNTQLCGGLGYRIGSIEKRLGALKSRMKSLHETREAPALRMAISEICPEHKDAIVERAKVIAREWADAADEVSA